MNHRQRMLAAMRGEPTDQIPWAPRMELWNIAVRARGTAPPHLANMDTAQLADALDFGCHAVRADYSMIRDPKDLALRGLGIDNHPDYPCRVECSLPMEFRQEEGHYYTTIHAPAGDVTMHLRMTKEMAVEAVSLPFAEKYPICSPEDFEPVAQVFEHLQVIPTPQAYDSFHQRIGDRGVAVACGPLGCSPMHLLLHDVMSMQDFFLLYMDDRKALEELAARIEPFYDALLEATLRCNAEAIFWGANYDHQTTWPPFFQEQIMPWLQKVSEQAHAVGKLLLTHTDGESRLLLPLFAESHFDIADSVCPAPMTTCTLKEFREGIGPDKCVYGGIPCTILEDNTVSERDFEAHMDQMFAELGTGERLILGVSDNVTPGVSLSRLERVKEWIESFGPVEPK